MEDIIQARSVIDHLDACETSIKKYLDHHGQDLDPERLALMFECKTICQRNLDNHRYGKEIGFLCSYICNACSRELDLDSEEISVNYDRLYDFLQASLGFSKERSTYESSQNQ